MAQLATVIAPAREFTSAYLYGQIQASDSQQKAECRDRILKFFADTHDQSVCPRLLSFPSANWYFEKQCIDLWPWMECVAVERDSRVYRVAVQRMPGPRTTIGQLDLGYGLVPCAESGPHRIALCHLSALLQSTRMGKSKNKQRQFVNQWKRWTMIWLDINSQICEEVEKCVIRLSAFCDYRIPCVPVAVTFFGERGTSDIKNKLYLLQSDRVDYMVRLLETNRHRAWVTDDVFAYETPGGTTLTTVVGRLLLRNPRSCSPASSTPRRTGATPCWSRP